MSDVMLLGVLRMPPELWGRGAIDVAQRHGYYKAAADRIEKDAARIRELEKEIKEVKNELVLAEQLLDWIDAAIDGERVCDFAESFPLVRKVVDLSMLRYKTPSFR